MVTAIPQKVTGRLVDGLLRSRNGLGRCLFRLAPQGFCGRWRLGHGQNGHCAFSVFGLLGGLEAHRSSVRDIGLVLLLSLLLSLVQIRLEFPDAGFGLKSAFSFLLEGGDFLARLWVDPPELAVFPSHQQVQHGGVAL